MFPLFFYQLKSINCAMFRSLLYVLVGTIFGIVFIKAEIVSWYRMQEMFRFHSFHMFGVIGTAVITAMISIFAIKKLGILSLDGEKPWPKLKDWNWGVPIGGFLFGIGWALTGACPGPIFVQLGTGSLAAVIIIVSAIAGTYFYGYFKDKLPH
jgi:uncharacterized membrane protein YedE/YeeE